MPEHEIKVVNYIEIPSTDPARAGKREAWILYTFDGAGPFMIVVPAELMSDAELRRRVMEQQRSRLEWLGRTVKG